MPKKTPQIFICYAHKDNENPDPRQRWLDMLLEYLAPLELQGQADIWSDQEIELGEEWHDKIQATLQQVKAAVLLVSPSFLASKYIRNSELPVLLKNAKDKGVVILPILLRECLWRETKFMFPDPKGGPEELYLSSIQVPSTKPLNSLKEHEQDKVLHQVAQKIYRIVNPDSIESALEQETGSSLLDYCCEEIKKPGSLLRIKAPWKMGKTDLMLDILNHFNNKDYKVVFLNLRLFDGEDCNNLEDFLRWFCFNITEKLQIEQRLNERWNEFMGSSQLKCYFYFQKYLLAGDKPLILGLDEVDKIFSHTNIAGYFLGLLRAWHEEAKVSETWQKLRIVFTYTESYTKMQVNQSPFNTGTEIKLPELNQTQVWNLAKTYDFEWDVNQVKSLMEMIGGHPYLIKRAFDYLKEQDQESVTLSLQSIIESGIYDDYLQRYWKYFKQYPDLIALLTRVVDSKKPIEVNPEFSLEQVKQLENLGLIRLRDNKAIPRFQLYREYFKQHLGEIR